MIRPEDLDKVIDRKISERLASSTRAMTVVAVNSDGTVSLDAGDGDAVTSQPAFESYTPRAKGDIVLVQVRGGEYVVMGTVGPATNIPDPVTLPSNLGTVTVSDSAAPGGQGWEAIVTGSVWGRNSPAGVWLKRITAAPPATTFPLSVSATNAVTYRGGSVSQSGKAEQGDYSGNGLQLGLFVFASGAFSALSGKTIVSGKATVTRNGAGHGFTYGPVSASLWKVLATGTPVATPTLLDVSASAPGLSLGETGSVTPAASWWSLFTSSGANCIACWSPNASENIELVSCQLDFVYS